MLETLFWNWSNMANEILKITALSTLETSENSSDQISDRWKFYHFWNLSYNIFQSVLEYAYNQFAQSKQRSEIVSKLYGKSWIRLSKTESEPTLISVIEKNIDYCGETYINFIEILNFHRFFYLDYLETILSDFRDDLKALTEKEVMQQTVSHKAFLDFFNLCLYLLHSEKEEIEKHK